MSDAQRPQLASVEGPQTENAQEQEKETGRVEAFSDGIFAVAITLLVLNIQVPSIQSVPNDSVLVSILLGNWRIYLAFVTSFATIGIMWMNHHRLFTLIKLSDTGLLTLNLLLMLFIVFVPFPTALLTQYYEHDYRGPAVIYSATFVLLAICFNLLWRYASHNNRLLDRKADPRAVQAITRQYRFGPLFYLVALGLAFVYPPASVIWNLLLALFFALPGQLVARISLTHNRRTT